MAEHPLEENRRKRKIQHAKKTIKRNRDDRPPRKKRWDESDYDDDFLADERIMPRDEGERRQKVAQMAQDVVLDEPADTPRRPRGRAARSCDGGQRRVVPRVREMTRSGCALCAAHSAPRIRVSRIWWRWATASACCRMATARAW